jgi:nicotinate-nucleotide adenylyltransferase
VTDSMKKIGLIGGTYNPVHKGHLNLARQAQKIFNLEKVVFIPACRSPHKLALEPVSSKHRLAMLTLALEGMPLFSIDKIEINKNEVSYTIETLKKLKYDQPDWSMFLILGADAFQAIETWKQYSQLLNYCNILVGTRPGTELQLSELVKKKLALRALGTKDRATSNTIDVKILEKKKKDIGITFFQISPLDISSKKIRQQINRGEEVKNLLPPSVDNYIMQHKLYKDNPTSNKA